MIGELTTTRNANSMLSTLKNLQFDYNSTDPKEQFRQAALGYGIILPDTIIGDGQIHRPKSHIAYKLHLDGRPAGFFQDFKQGIKATWKAEGQRKEYSLDEKQAYKKSCLEREMQRQERELSLQAEAASKALYIWPRSTPAPENHPSLVAKKNKPHSARVYHDALVYPIYDRNKQLVNLQFIHADRTKRFLKGGKKKCCFSVIGQSDDGPIDITEGFSTGASIRENIGHQTVIALDCGNLEAVARVWRELFPDRPICIYGDNDISGVGQAAAKKAAAAVSGTYTIPINPGTDWNDVFSSDKGALI